MSSADSVAADLAFAAVFSGRTSIAIWVVIAILTIPCRGPPWCERRTSRKWKTVENQDTELLCS